MCFLFKIVRQSMMAAWSIPRLKTISAPLKIVLRLTTISFPLKMMLIGVNRARSSMVMLRMVYADALTRLYPLTSLCSVGATEAYSVASIESDLFIKNLLLLLDRQCPCYDRETLRNESGSMACLSRHISLC